MVCKFEVMQKYVSAFDELEPVGVSAVMKLDEPLEEFFSKQNVCTMTDEKKIRRLVSG